jgi:inner membrane protein
VPTIGHLAAGYLAGQVLARDPTIPRGRALGAGVGLACAPDLDLIGALFGTSPWSPWVHRGASHSLLAATVLGLGTGLLLARRWGLPRLRTMGWAVATVASHLALDLLNRDSKVEVLWPWDPQFLPFPWQPIPGVDKVTDLLTFRGLPVLGAEAALFAPILLLGYWLGRRAPE